MPETPEQFFRRVVHDLRMPPAEEWDTFPFEGHIGIPQLLGSFAAVWDDVLPPAPEDMWRANLGHVAAQLSDRGPGSP